MKENRLIIFSVLAVLCISVLLLLMMGKGKKRFLWYESYRADSEQPYGTLLLKKLLEGYRDDQVFTVNTRKPLRILLNSVSDAARTDYVFVGQSIHLDSASVQALARFLDEGGDAFIASYVPPEELLSLLYEMECDGPLVYDYESLKSVELNFYHGKVQKAEGFRYAYRFVDVESDYPWRYVNSGVFCGATEALVPLGYYDDHRVNFLRMPVGRGNLFLHTNPLVFTNYFLVDKSKLDYVSTVFSHLDGRDIIWDEFSKLSTSDNTYNSPLYYLLAQPSLKYAWWLLLVTVVVYVAFAARRKQRIIPVLEPKRNTSLEYVNMIARLHYNNGNHLDMAHKKMKYFLYFVRSRYGIFAERFDEEHIRRLADKSRVELSDVQMIFSRYHLIEDRFQNNIEASRLVALCESIDNFYKRAK